MLSDLTTLIDIRYKHQSKEEANAVRIARTPTDAPPHQDSGLEQGGAAAAASDSSQRRQLIKKINDIIKASATSSASENAGSNRRTRWNMPGSSKAASGSTLPVDRPAVPTGNSANAQAAARKVAQVVSLLSILPLSSCTEAHIRRLSNSGLAHLRCCIVVTIWHRLKSATFSISIADHSVLLHSMAN
jgi:hypothetical protein